MRQHRRLPTTRHSWRFTVRLATHWPSFAVVGRRRRALRSLSSSPDLPICKGAQIRRLHLNKNWAVGAGVHGTESRSKAWADAAVLRGEKKSWRCSGSRLCGRLRRRMLAPEHHESLDRGTAPTFSPRPGLAPNSRSGRSSLVDERSRQHSSLIGSGTMVPILTKGAGRWLVAATERSAMVTELLERIGETVGQRAQVSTIFGEPVQREAVTVIPVAKARFGFGGGGGSGARESDQGSGGGGGGGVAVSPGRLHRIARRRRRVQADLQREGSCSARCRRLARRGSAPTAARLRPRNESGSLKRWLPLPWRTWKATSDRLYRLPLSEFTCGPR